jgi:hypothetical protein
VNPLAEPRNQDVFHLTAALFFDASLTGAAGGFPMICRAGSSVSLPP